MEVLVIAAMFGASAALLAWGSLSMREEIVPLRLEEPMMPIVGAAPKRPPRLIVGLGRLLSPMNTALVSSDARERLDTTLTLGQVRVSSIQFLALKEAAAVGIILALLALGQNSPALLVLAALTGFFVPDLWLRIHMKARNAQISRDLPEVVDLLSLCVSAGSDFMAAMSRVVREFRPGPLTEELALVLREVQVGRRRRVALKAMAERVRSPEVSSFVRTLVQADRMGTEIGEALRILAEETRIRRYHMAERFAAKAPIMLQFMQGTGMPKLS